MSANSRGKAADLLDLKFNRDDERDADLVGLEIAARAGYDPSAGITLWEKMGQAAKNAPPTWLSTHPSGEDRIRRTKEALKQVVPLYEKAKANKPPVAAPANRNITPTGSSAVRSGGELAWLTEWLATALDLRPGMRVLDLGCGRAASSIFLHREFGVQVWATDLWFDASENDWRIRDAGVEDGVFPLHSDARSLPFAA